MMEGNQWVGRGGRSRVCVCGGRLSGVINKAAGI